VDDAAAEDLARALCLLPVTARCMAGRGLLLPDESRAFLAPRLGALRPPEGLAGLDGAVRRLARATMRGERVGIFGDYDVDGVTTAALLTTFLRQIGVACVARVASRAAGYGLGLPDVAALADQGVSLIVTGDCGTSDVEAIGNASSRGIDVIVVDHHTVPIEREGAPPHPAYALINPRRADSTFPFRGLASVGLSFYVVAALRTGLRREGFFNERPEPDIRELLDLVAVGTVADMVPLVGENRILTRAGLRLLAARRRPGLAALLGRAGVDPSRPIDERDIGWRIAPRLNAPGRLGEAEPALALLLATDGADAGRLAGEIEDANTRRRALQDQVTAEALAQIGAADRDTAALVVAGAGWSSGVVGIVAARLVDRFSRPAFAIAVDPATGEGRGSARTVDGIDLYEVLAACAPRLARFGGHAAAAGITLARADAAEVDRLRSALCEAVAARTPAAPPATQTAAVIDAEVALGEVDERLAAELAGLAPFGQGNEAPRLLCRGVRVSQSRRVGEEGRHLKLELEDAGGQRRGAIAFGQGPADPGVGAAIDIAFEPSVNEWRGQRRVELTIREIAPAR
jgi:single-stranded-DNA-specific exonuclease